MERLLTEFAQHADRTRFEPSFISLTTRGPMAASIETAGWKVLALGSSGGIKPSLLFALARLFREQDIQVVHTHNTRPLLYAGPAARLARVPVVVHTRHGQRCNATPRQTRLFRLAARTADRFVCVSHDSMRLTIAEGIEAARTMTIWNGVDPRRWSPCHDPAGPAVFVGRLSVEKDLPTLVKAAALIAQRRPGFQLRIAGDGPCRGLMLSQIRQHHIESHIDWRGEVADVASVLNGASMFILPSRSEGLPVTVLEAMASGLPVVATDAGGVREVVADGRTGLLVPCSDPERMAEAVLSLLDHPVGGSQLGSEARRRVEEHFDVRTMVAHYEALYENLLRSKQVMAA